MFELVSREPESFNKSLGFFETEDLCILSAIDRDLIVFGIRYWYTENYKMFVYGMNILEAKDFQEDN